jgi:hypothetical protein
MTVRSSKRCSNTPRPPLAVNADKAYDSKEARQQIKDEGALLVIPSRSNATKKATAPSVSIASATRSKTSSVAPRTGGALRRDATSSPAISSPPL